MQRDLSNITSIREMPTGLFWTRETEITPEEAQEQSAMLQVMPVAGTGYLLNEYAGETMLLAVPHRHRN